MSDPTGDERHQRVVLALRVGGVVLTAIGLVLLITGFIGFVDVMSSDTGSDFGPDPASEDSPISSFLVFAAGMPFVAVGSFCLRAGFFGAATRFAARESTPALRQIKDDLWPAPPPPATGRFCGSCGAQRGAEDRFCPGCGTALGPN